MIKIKKAIKLSLLEIELQDVLKDIKKHESIINSIKVDDGLKKTSKMKLKNLINLKNKLSDQITEEMFL